MKIAVNRNSADDHPDAWWWTRSDLVAAVGFGFLMPVLGLVFDAPPPAQWLAKVGLLTMFFAVALVTALQAFSRKSSARRRADR